MIRKALTYGAIGLFLWVVAQAPGPWADTAKTAGHTIKDVAVGWGQFFTNLAA